MTRTNGGDKDDRRHRERRGRREWRRVCVCVRARVFACVCTCTCASTHVLRGWSAPQFLASPGRNATTTAARTESKYTQATQVLSLYTSRLEINGRGNSMPAAMCAFVIIPHQPDIPPPTSLSTQALSNNTIFSKIPLPMGRFHRLLLLTATPILRR